MYIVQVQVHGSTLICTSEALMVLSYIQVAEKRPNLVITEINDSKLIIDE